MASGAQPGVGVARAAIIAPGRHGAPGENLMRQEHN